MAKWQLHERQKGIFPNLGAHISNVSLTIFLWVSILHTLSPRPEDSVTKTAIK